MKHLGKLILIIILISFASESYAQFLVGARVGVNMSNMLWKDDDDTYSEDYKMKMGFHAGPAVQIGIAPFLSLETGLILSTRGYKWSEESGGEEYSTKVNLLYLDIPINGKFTFGVGATKIFVIAGPYIGIGLSGKAKQEYKYGDYKESDTHTVEWGSDEEKHDLKRLDFGLTAGAGVQIKIIQVSVYYNLGLANISPYTENGAKIANRNIGVSVAVFFGGGGGGDNTRD